MENFNQQSNALAEIQAIEHQILQGGNVDSEKNQLDEILKKLQKNLITPEEALKQARILSESRQNYH